jgi:hypothetical protein
MNRRILPIVASMVLTVASAAVARAQSQASQETQPAPASAPAQPTAQNSASNPPATSPAQKKVWTNDEMSALDPHAGVSSVGNSPTSSPKPGPKPKTTSKNRDAKWYQDQIAKLQAKIPPLDKQIAELQDAIDGKPTGDAKQSARPRSVKADDWATEMAALQKQRDDAYAQINALQDQARHSGVAPNALP